MTCLITVSPEQSLIDQLEDDSYIKRANAYKKLEAMDVEALPILKANMNHLKPETRYSVRRLINRIINPVVVGEIPCLSYFDNTYMYMYYIDYLSPFNINVLDRYQELRSAAYKEIYAEDKPSLEQVFLFGLVGIQRHKVAVYDVDQCAFLSLVSELRWDGMTLDELNKKVIEALKKEKVATNRNTLPNLDEEE